MCIMGAHQQKFLQQHKLQLNADIMYENIFSTTKINFSEFHKGLQDPKGKWTIKKNPYSKFRICP